MADLSRRRPSIAAPPRPIGAGEVAAQQRAWELGEQAMKSKARPSALSLALSCCGAALCRWAHSYNPYG